MIAQISKNFKYDKTGEQQNSCGPDEEREKYGCSDQHKTDGILSIICHQQQRQCRKKQEGSIRKDLIEELNEQGIEREQAKEEQTLSLWKTPSRQKVEADQKSCVEKESRQFQRQWANSFKIIYGRQDEWITPGISHRSNLVR